MTKKQTVKIVKNGTERILIILQKSEKAEKI